MFKHRNHQITDLKKFLLSARNDNDGNTYQYSRTAKYTLSTSLNANYTDNYV